MHKLCFGSRRKVCRLFGSQLVRVFCHLSTHSLKARLLAAAGQLNLNLDSRAKQGHHKKSVQFHLRDDAWPSRFLQRHILMEISQGWRPLHARREVPDNHYRNQPSFHHLSPKLTFNTYKYPYQKIFQRKISLL